MAIRHACGVIGAALLSSAAVFAQPQEQTPWQITHQDDSPITLVGCVQKESDYRREHDIGKGGFLNLGGGTGDEYVLITAFRGSSAEVPAAAGDCAARGVGEAYELTGSREDELDVFLGRRVEITGMLKEAELEPVGTTGAVRPEGGHDPVGRDLKLFEVNVASFREAPVPAPAASVPARIEPKPEPFERIAPAAVPAPEYVAQEPAAELPKTASPVPLFGLLGLLSLGGALGIQLFRRV